MLPNYRAFDIEKRLRKRAGVKNEYKELVKLIDNFKEAIKTYNRRKRRYEDMGENYDEKDEFSKTRGEYEHDIPILKAAIDKKNKDICTYARAFGILKQTDIGDIIEEGNETQRKQRIKGRGRFRMRTSATDVGVDMGTDRIIRSVNRISDNMNKKFK